MLHFSSLLGPTTERKGIASAKVVLKGMATSLPNKDPQSGTEVMIMQILASIAILALPKMLYFGSFSSRTSPNCNFLLALH